jgi:hypothetical protein
MAVTETEPEAISPAKSVENIQGTYAKASGKTSDIARQLSLAGVAFIWIFSGGNVVTTSQGHLVVTNDLLAAGLCFVIALGLDLLQYVYRSIAFGFLGWFREKKLQNNKVIDTLVPRPLNYPTLFCFWAKVAAVITGYIFLGFGIANKIH